MTQVNWRQTLRDFIENKERRELQDKASVSRIFLVNEMTRPTLQEMNQFADEIEKLLTPEQKATVTRTDILLLTHNALVGVDKCTCYISNWASLSCPKHGFR